MKNKYLKIAFLTVIVLVLLILAFNMEELVAACGVNRKIKGFSD